MQADNIFRSEPEQGNAESEVSKLSGVFLSLFKTVDLSVCRFGHCRRRPHSYNPQQHQILSDVWQQDEIFAQAHRNCRDDRSLQFRRRPRQSSTKPRSACIRRATSSQSRFLWGWGSLFAKRSARSTFSTSALENAERFLAPDRAMRRRGPCSRWAVCPSIVAPRISRKLVTKSCEISSRRKHGH
jgi:hypothetical protein